jgi:glycosyltransferase involved in cell wall biosynthesis
VVFLLAGKLIALKRPLSFISAIAEARNERIHGLVAGDGPLRTDAEALAAALNAHIRFTGFLNQSEIAAAYRASDALVLPSARETWGMVVNEAMAFGLPCLVSQNVGAGPDLVTAGETGFIFDGSDTAALARLMNTAPAQLRRMGAGARARVAAYSPAATADGVEQALSFVVRSA